MVNIRHFYAACAVALFGSFGTGHSASVATYSFQNIATENASEQVGDALASSFSLDVSQYGAARVIFQISSAASNLSHFIGRVYVDASASLFAAVPNGSSGTFSSGTTNFRIRNDANLPQGDTAGFTGDLAFGHVTRGRANRGHRQGVQSGETVGFLFGASYDDVLASLDSGLLRFGLQVQNIGLSRSSDSFVMATPTAVPIPAGGLLLMTGLGALAALRRRKVKSVVA